ncbi:MAG: hypothetical protein NC110_06330, partial [Ruminococcus sp.]|nr:hypothetical protein [Ruminococcus sp.]
KSSVSTNADSVTKHVTTKPQLTKSSTAQTTKKPVTSKPATTKAASTSTNSNRTGEITTSYNQHTTAAVMSTSHNAVTKPQKTPFAEIQTTTSAGEAAVSAQMQNTVSSDSASETVSDKQTAVVQGDLSQNSDVTESPSSVFIKAPLTAELPKSSPDNSNKTMIIMACVLVAAFTGVGGYAYTKKKNQNKGHEADE